MGKHNKPKFYDFMKSKKAAEAKPPAKTKEELFKDYQACATGLVQRSSVRARLEDEINQLGHRLRELETAIDEANKSEEQAKPKEAPSAAPQS